MRILITGGTGFIGRYLMDLLVQRGDRVAVVSRNPMGVRNLPAGCEAVEWLPDLGEFDAVVNLAGEPLVGKRWSEAQKARILESRTGATNRIVEAIFEATTRPKVLLNASAIGIYGNRGDEVLNEDSDAARDFVGDVCTAWEAAARRAPIRTVMVRIGLVLGNGGGALAKMLPPFRLGLGGPMGSGQQWMSWIHIEDLCRLMLHAIDSETMSGPYNGTAPNPVTNQQFAKTLGKVLKRPAFLPAPTLVLKIALGEVSHLLTDSQRCESVKTLATGFEFQQPDLEPALRDLLHK